MGPQNVDTVLIAGKVMKRNGQLVGVEVALPDWGTKRAIASVPEAHLKVSQNDGSRLPMTNNHGTIQGITATTTASGDERESLQSFQIG
jgi:hypothetical protein